MTMNSPVDPQRAELDHRTIVRLARRASSSHALREEVVQEAWLELLERPPRDRQALPRLAWLVVVHAAMRLGRRERERAHREQAAAVPDFTPAVDDELTRAAVREQLVAQVARLDEPYSTVVRLRFFEELSTEEIARRVGRSEGTVRSQLKRGLDRLRTRLGEPESHERWNMAGFGFFAWLRKCVRPERAARSPRALFTAAGAGALVIALSVWLLVRAPSDQGDAPKLALAPAGGELAPPPFVLEDAPSERGPVEPPQQPPSTAAATAVPDTAAIVRGSLVNRADGTRVVDARILVASPDRPDEGTVLATTDERGEFSFASPPLPALVWAEHADLASTLQTLVEPWFVEEERKLDLATFGGWKVRGRVLDPSGQGVAGAEVRTHALFDRDPPVIGMGALRLKERRAPSSTVAITDERGFFACPSHAAARNILEVRAPSHPPTLLWVDRDQADVEVRVPRAASIEGRVTFAGGEPAPATRVVLDVDWHFRYEAVTAQDGTFAFAQLPVGDFLLRAGGASAPLSFAERGVLAEGECRRLEVALGERSSIAVQASDGAGPLGGWAVELYANRQTVGATHGALVARAILDDEGRAAFGELMPEAFELLLFPPGSSDGIAHARRADVTVGSRVELRVEEEAKPSAFLTGRVVGDAALWERRPRLALDGAALSRPLELELGDSGRFRFGSLAPGEYVLELRADGYAALPLAERVRVDARAEHDLGDLEVPAPGSLRIAAHRRDGSVAELSILKLFGMGLEINAHRAAPGEGLSLDPALSEWIFDSLWPGPYRIVARGEGLADEELELRIEPGEERRLEIEMRPGCLIHVWIEAEGGCDGEDALRFQLRTTDRRQRFALGLRSYWKDPQQVVFVKRSLPENALALEVQSSSGRFAGEIDFTREPPYEGRKYELRLEAREQPSQQDSATK